MSLKLTQELKGLSIQSEKELSTGTRPSRTRWCLTHVTSEFCTKKGTYRKEIGCKWFQVPQPNDFVYIVRFMKKEDYIA